jgi:hypothetical protein
MSPGTACGSPWQVTSRREPRRFLFRSRLRPVETISAASSKASLCRCTTTDFKDCLSTLTTVARIACFTWTVRRADRNRIHQRGRNCRALHQTKTSLIILLIYIPFSSCNYDLNFVPHRSPRKQFKGSNFSVKLITCVSCHKPSMQTGPSAVSSSLAFRNVPLYSDLLLQRFARDASSFVQLFDFDTTNG